MIARPLREPHPPRQGRGRGPARGAGAPGRPPRAAPPRTKALDRQAVERVALIARSAAPAPRRRASPCRAGSRPGRARPGAERWGSRIARTESRASRSPSTTARTRRARRSCWRSCARPGAPATFFLAGEQVERRPALAAEIVAAGHRVELHCHRHRNLLRLTARQFLDDAERGRAAIEEAERAGDRRLPPALRDLQRRRPAGGAGAAAGGRCSGRSGGGTGRGGATRATRSRAARPRRPRAGDIVLLHDADYYSARGSWVRTAAALPIILEELGQSRAEGRLAAPLSRRREGPLLAAGEGFVEAPRHRAPGPVLVEDLLGHELSVL